MTHRDEIIEFLSESQGFYFCDDCISEILEIFPRQQVNQITRRLDKDEIVDRIRSFCKNCLKKNKFGVSIKSEKYAVIHSPVIPLQSKLDVRVDEIRTEIARKMVSLWNNYKPVEIISLAQRILILRREGYVPNLVANLMLAICILRNSYVYDDRKFDQDEIAVISSGWKIIQKWFIEQGI